MEIHNNIFDEDDDDILLNPILYINQFETNNNKINNIKTNLFQKENENIYETQNRKKHNSPNSTFNTNAALDECSNDINYNISFFSFNGNQRNEHQQKKEMTQKSIEILSELIEKEKKILDNANSINDEEDKKEKTLKIKEMKNNFIKLELSLKDYLKIPFMRTNYLLMKKFENKFDEDEKKINISDDIDINIDDSKKNCKEKKMNINNIINNSIKEI
jgi:hypothetical protein